MTPDAVLIGTSTGKPMMSPAPIFGGPRPTLFCRQDKFFDFIFARGDALFWWRWAHSRHLIYSLRTPRLLVVRKGMPQLLARTPTRLGIPPLGSASPSMSVGFDRPTICFVREFPEITISVALLIPCMESVGIGLELSVRSQAAGPGGATPYDFYTDDRDGPVVVVGEHVGPRVTLSKRTMNDGMIAYLAAGYDACEAMSPRPIRILKRNPNLPWSSVLDVWRITKGFAYATSS
ncbi:hypothetical protein BV22DRAFT_1050501 [Leucogyrophana mollusca]|uniref:Uncharacterized protein n=1 Tax=Leucogyrophana mollusca TaxID=85980 RepID=A0ACB8B4U5_9AGAM|nr:hypothetical protein BV22DRAFT_1050501 [Leucogyrophana mollusca]